MKTAFWLSTALLLYTYVGYAVVLLVLAALHQIWTDLRYGIGRRERRRRSSGETLPPVTLVFAAYNEEAVIREKMRNCAALDYPAHRLEILVGCDGCSDRTAQIARVEGIPNARVIELSERSGKPSVLNRLVPQARGEIIVFCDANTMLEPDALRSLVRHFSRPDVGCVCGELRLANHGSGPYIEGLYWRYETLLKFLESRLNALLGVNGAVFAIRRELFQALPTHGIVDDFLVGMRIRAAGWRIIYDPEAVAREEAAGSLRDEFRRRVRIGAGNFHALGYTWRLLLPGAGMVAFAYWSHKVLRWFAPVALIGGFASAWALVADPIYAAAAGAGLLVVTLALAGYGLERRHVHRSLFSIPYYFLSMNLALVMGFLRFLTGRQTTVWTRTPRHQESVP
jgi:cellulose synthase/poly-beta-1,6-N-acetylglucosamine synthase-like glycosyltransferase